MRSLRTPGGALADVAAQGVYVRSCRHLVTGRYGYQEGLAGSRCAPRQTPGETMGSGRQGRKSKSAHHGMVHAGRFFGSYADLRALSAVPGHCRESATPRGSFGCGCRAFSRIRKMTGASCRADRGCGMRAPPDRLSGCGRKPSPASSAAQCSTDPRSSYQPPTSEWTPANQTCSIVWPPPTSASFHRQGGKSRRRSSMESA